MNNNGNTANSPMHIGMDGPAGGVNTFTVDEIQELMGLIPNEQQQHSISSGVVSTLNHLDGPTVLSSTSQHRRVNSLDDLGDINHLPMQEHVVNNTVAVSSGLHSVLSGERRGQPQAPAPSSAGKAANGNNNDIDEGSKNQVRSERKRSREKQRRTDVNKQFGELTEVLKRIESEEQHLQQERAAREEAREGGPTSSNGSSISSSLHQSSSARMILPPFSPTNRVDLIARTIAHLERLSHVTKKQVQELQNLEEQLKTAQKAGEDMAQKLKEAVFNQQQQGVGMMMNGMMGMNGGANPAMYANPMQMAMSGGMNSMGMVSGAPGASNANTNGMMSIQPQKQQMMMMVPMMMPPNGANASAGASGTPMMPAGNQPFMMMPQAFLPSQQQHQQAPGPSSTNVTNSNTPTSSNTAVPFPDMIQQQAPAPAVVSQQQQQLQNQQATMMQQAMMMQSMQPMMQQQHQQQHQQPSMEQQQPQVQMQHQQPQQQQQYQMIYPAPQQQAQQPAPIMAAPMSVPATAGMAASQQLQQQNSQQHSHRSSPAGSAGSNGSNSGTMQPSQISSQHQHDPTNQQQQGSGGGSYAYAA